MRRKKNKIVDDYPQDRSFPTYVMLGCTLIIIFIGLYLTITRQIANGILSAGRTGSGGGSPIALNGPSILITGLLLCIYPIYVIVKNKNKWK